LDTEGSKDKANPFDNQENYKAVKEMTLRQMSIQ